MKLEPTALPEVLLLEPRVYRDARGWFYESWNRRAFWEATGVDTDFVQDNHSRSARNVLRGLHYQLRQPQGKLIRVIAGEVFDVAVDLRRGSPRFGRTACVRLDAESRRMLWVPAGFAHGFLVISEFAELQYKATDYYAPAHERTLMWNDPALGIAWPIQGEPLLGEKDRRGTLFEAAETYD